MSLDKLTNVIKKEIRELAKEFKEENGNSSLRIPNKDINLWIVKEIMELRNDIGIMKVKTKLLQWFFGIAIALMAIFQII